MRRLRPPDMGGGGSEEVCRLRRRAVGLIARGMWCVLREILEDESSSDEEYSVIVWSILLGWSWLAHF